MMDTIQKKLSDPDILDLIDQFEAWRDKVGLSPREGLWQMLAFVRAAIESGEGLYARMLERQRGFIREMANTALRYPHDAALAADYISEQYHGDPAILDYDGAFFFCSKYLGDVADKSTDTKLAGEYHCYLRPATGGRYTAYWSVYRDSNIDDSLTEMQKQFAQDFRQRELELLARPVIVDLLHLGINIPMFVDSMQFGMGAWDEGRTIALTVDEYITSPQSQGQLCSLYPPDARTPVDWRSKDWARQPEFLDYSETEGRGERPLPEWARQWMQRSTRQR